MALSDAWLKANSGKKIEKRFEKADRDGLSVRVTPQGKITFQLRYRYDGKAARVDLGSYPLTTLKNARSEGQRLKGKLEQGYDPRVVKQLEKQAILNADSLEELFLQWYHSYCKENKKGHHEILRSFQLYVFPAVGHLPAEEVTLHEWLALLEKRAQATPGIADRILTNAKQMLKWGVRRRLITSNPIANINATEDLRIKKGTGTRSLSPDEISMMWQALEHSRMAPKNKIFLKLCLFYGCRNGELRVSEKQHFDFEKRIWTVPPANHKMGKSTKKPLLRPITPEIEPLLKEAFLLSGESKHLFNNSGSDKPMGQGAPLALPYNLMQWLRRHRDYEMKHWSVHDLRKTARTNFSELTEPHIAEIMLGHKLPGQWQVYDHYDYLKEQREAYTKWWERLTEFTALSL
ncbi:site-specific integrase [Microbulbifer sp. THAF38]|uniref:tyrosine-type recombinase/integrase n=1 Tax=Microbulbifer sp. THAF38 TaxID=2587856 RepID=UPI001267D592|nr:site-specific integrase [Microbulbifer sp. THAF38]QFT53561.1 Putative prophage CPS-53 integrase [Microbulbifer sp. THAF38]